MGDVFREVLNLSEHRSIKIKKMSLMVLGSSSHAGKSTVVSAICRCLYNHGYRCAPFKSQNMSLNSYVTGDGSEIGIAQAVQAAAAGIDPSAEMNPVLLKPKGDRSSQVVLLGRPYKDVRIGEYYKETDHLLTVAVDSYHSLEKKYGNVVVEGAGGAAEMNLYDRDIANVLLAMELDIPIVIVGDIERGGIFAQLIGTFELLPDKVRRNVSGFIINKFRGDPSLFEDGVSIIEEKTGVKVLGVLPYCHVGLLSEDSLSIADKNNAVTAKKPVTIGVVRLPRISNFSDFEPLERYAEVRYIDPEGSFEGIDCLVLPGTKNTIDDLGILRSVGFEEKLRSLIERKVPVFGICGGLQMLGREIVDSGVESGMPCTVKGFSVLDIKTEFLGYEKTTVRVTRRSSGIGPILSGVDSVSGYEIHMGSTSPGKDTSEAFIGDGAVSADGLVIGTYMHGLFENVNIARALIDYLCERKGITFEDPVFVDEDAFDILCETFEKNVDVNSVLEFFSK